MFNLYLLMIRFIAFPFCEARMRTSFFIRLFRPFRTGINPVSIDARKDCNPLLFLRSLAKIYKRSHKISQSFTKFVKESI